MHPFYDFALCGGGGWHMFVLWILLVGVIVWLILSLKNGRFNQNSQQHQRESALDIAKKRYARGEISKDELDEIKRNL